MPYRYIGRTTEYKGNTLWEIVGNLKNFGVGRLITRSQFERYPEPTYYKILKVEPLDAPEQPTMDNARKVQVWVEKTFRGVAEPDPALILRVSYKPDFRLIPKDEEESFCKKIQYKSNTVYPKYMEFPPLFRELIIRERQAAGDQTKEEPKLEIIYSASFPHRIAKDGEVADRKFSIGLGETKSLSLYKNIKLQN